MNIVSKSTDAEGTHGGHMFYSDICFGKDGVEHFRVI